MAEQKGILAIFKNPEDLKVAARKVRELKIKNFDAFTPFPVHGLEDAMGLARSKIPYATLILGLAGWGLLYLFQAWTSAVSWPINVGGKPLVSWPAFIPISFEGMVLIGGVLTVVILVLVCSFRNFGKKPLHAGLTDDRFGLFVDHADPRFQAAELNQICRECHAEEIKNIE